MKLGGHLLIRLWFFFLFLVNILLSSEVTAELERYIFSQELCSDTLDLGRNTGKNENLSFSSCKVTRVS